ncbi:hypothetical protein LMG28727_01356 [Paraburkholderia kirstenboschensis]|uniref:hypothetical protein n=1 Tax=Paraburkholderia kirstenboschensis TaxID=1245436 RepID=UPI000ABF43AE|nr:hypothetical protein [Paraburkholderia kirstenboschensis]CAD6516623.1 hypothetical protein LMG28727_01356 [Paraburkholderia kirstenboschensis]
MIVRSGSISSNFVDNRCFFIPPVTSGNLFVLVMNVDADAMTLALTIKTIGIQ